MKSMLEMSAPAIAEKIVPSAKQKILLVDDDPAIRQILFRLLVAEEYRVQTAANGVEALEIADHAKLDLVLLDLNMPVKDGWETFEQLSIKNPLVPVILITARPNQFFLARAAGVGALLEKPLDIEKLFHTIHNLLEEPPEACLARYAGRAPMFCYAHPETCEPAYAGEAEWGAN